MNYTIEDVSPVMKKVVLALQKEEVNTAIATALKLYGEKVTMRGFRKGSVPEAVLENHYKDQIYAEARRDLVNAHWQTVLSETGLTPIGDIHVDQNTTFARDADYSFNVYCEILPEKMELPNYEGLQVTVRKLEMRPDYLDEALKVVQRQNAKLVPIEGNGPAEDEQVVNIDYSFFRGSKELKDLRVQNFDLLLGHKQSLPEFEALVKSIPLGEEGSAKIHFPQDFVRPELRGLKILTKVKVNAIKRVELPEINDELAQKLHNRNVEDLKENLRQTGLEQIANTERDEAKRLLLSQLMKVCEPPLIKSYVNYYLNHYIISERERAERAGRAPQSDEALTKIYQSHAEYAARELVLLLVIAKKEGLSVEDKEVQMNLYNAARREGIDYNALRRQYEESGFIYYLRDSLLGEKAANLIYERAKVAFIEVADPKAANVEATPAEQEQTSEAQTKESEQAGESEAKENA